MDTAKQSIIHWYRGLEKIFTDEEAWTLFKVSAILETIGWTLLITGIVFKRLALPLDDWILPIGGSIHGVLVIGYMFIVFFAHRSMHWSFWRMVVAEVVSVIPYAVLFFEMWVAYTRRQKFYAATIAVAAASSGRD